MEISIETILLLLQIIIYVILITNIIWGVIDLNNVSTENKPSESVGDVVKDAMVNFDNFMNINILLLTIYLIFSLIILIYFIFIKKHWFIYIIINIIVLFPVWGTIIKVSTKPKGVRVLPRSNE